MTISRTISASNQWLPQTPQDRQLVLDELKAILSSHHFSNSKRYPALLAHVVNKALDGHPDQLKERTLGIEVFYRTPNYDTNADPVVRFSAGEVRKRIAQFYHENGAVSEVQIDLPPGSYVPEFKLRLSESRKQSGEPVRTESEAKNIRVQAPAVVEAPMPPVRWAAIEKPWRVAFKAYFAWTAVLLLALIPMVAFALHRIRSFAAVDEMWSPLLKSSSPVQIVIGNGVHEVLSPPDPQREVLVNQLHGAYNHLSVCDVVAVSRIAAVLGNRSRPYEIKEANFASLQDLRNRSVILIGAYNNLWTLRLMQPLRFHFLKDGHSVRIVDAKDSWNSDWVVDYSTANPSTVNDYAIVARYSDPTTGGSVMVIAGIGAYGTQAASEAVSTPHGLEKLLASMPEGWENKNLEIVIKTAVINGEAGPAEPVSATTW